MNTPRRKPFVRRAELQQADADRLRADPLGVFRVRPDRRRIGAAARRPGGRLLPLERRFRVHDQAAASSPWAALPGERRRAQDGGVRRRGHRSRRAVLLRGPQQDLDADPQSRPEPVRAVAVHRRDPAPLGPHVRRLERPSHATAGTAPRAGRRIPRRPAVRTKSSWRSAAAAEQYRARVRERPAVYVHIGAPKTGTTYLQNILFTQPCGAAPSRPALPRQRGAQPFLGQPGSAWDDLPRARRGPGLRRVDPDGGRDPRVRRPGGDRPRDPRCGVRRPDRSRARRPRLRRGARRVHRARHRPTTSGSMAGADQESGHPVLRGLPRGRARGLAGTGPRKYFWPLHDVPEILARWSRNLARTGCTSSPCRRPEGTQALLWQRFASVLGSTRTDTTPNCLATTRRSRRPRPRCSAN